MIAFLLDYYNTSKNELSNKFCDLAEEYFLFYKTFKFFLKDTENKHL